MTLFPGRLRQLRSQNGTMQGTLAKFLHRSPGSISNYEKGRTDCPTVPGCLPKAIYGQYTVGQFLDLLGRLLESDRKALVYGLRVLEDARFPKKG